MEHVVDLAYLNDISGGNDVVRNKFLQVVKVEFPQEREAYFDLIKTKKNKEAAELVHKIKNKFGILGLNNGYQIAVNYEEGLKVEDYSLKTNFETVLAVVSNYIQKI